MKTFEEFLDTLPERLSGYEWLLCRRTWDIQQAKINRLMFEYCQDEMTPEQIKEFEDYQK